MFNNLIFISFVIYYLWAEVSVIGSCRVDMVYYIYEKTYYYITLSEGTTALDM